MRGGWLALEHKAFSYELKSVRSLAGDLAKPEYLAINPRRKVPAVVDGDFPIYESAAIVEYWMSSIPPGRGYFGSVRQRAETRRLGARSGRIPGACARAVVDQVLSPSRKDGIRMRFPRGAKLSSRSWEGSKAICLKTGSGSEVSAADFAVYPILRCACAWRKKGRLM